MGTVCKATAIILLILDFIGSVTLGNIFGKYDFNWEVFFYGVITGFVFCLLIYAVGEIIAQLEKCNDNSKKIIELLKSENICKPAAKIQIAETHAPIGNNSIAENAVKPNVGHKWLCNSCGKLRDKSPCPYCGNK